MKKVVASRARRRTHRRGGQEQKGPTSGNLVASGTGEGPWWGMYFDERRSRPSNRANGRPALVTTTQGLRPGMIACQADYSAARPLDIPGGERLEQSLPALPVRDEEVRTNPRRAPALPVSHLP